MRHKGGFKTFIDPLLETNKQSVRQVDINILPIYRSIKFTLTLQKSEGFRASHKSPAGQEGAEGEEP
jgi:hypothetical protein